MTDKDIEYIEKHKDTLEIAYKNCQLLFDPKNQRTREEIFQWIESNPTDRILLFQFIVNTCETVGGLQPIHIIAVSGLYRQLSPEQLQYFGDLIKNEFYQPIDIIQNGGLQQIWGELIQLCVQKSIEANGSDTDDLSGIVGDLNQLKLNQPETNQIITEQSESQNLQ